MSVGYGAPPIEHRFTKGRSGNPAGRPKGIARVARELVGDDGETLVRFWAAVMAGGPLPDGREPTVKESLEASKLLAERGFGRPPQFAPIENDDPLDPVVDASETMAAALERRLNEVAARRREREERDRQGAPSTE